MYRFIQAPNLRGSELVETQAKYKSCNSKLDPSVFKGTNMININHEPFNLASRVFTSMPAKPYHRMASQTTELKSLKKSSDTQRISTYFNIQLPSMAPNFLKLALI